VRAGRRRHELGRLLRRWTSIRPGLGQAAVDPRRRSRRRRRNESFSLVLIVGVFLFRKRFSTATKNPENPSLIVVPVSTYCSAVHYRTPRGNDYSSFFYCNDSPLEATTLDERLMLVCKGSDSPGGLNSDQLSCFLRTCLHHRSLVRLTNGSQEHSQ
jgi:hypothetical protein